MRFDTQLAAGYIEAGGSSLLAASVRVSVRDVAEGMLIRLGGDRSSISDHQFELVVGA